MSVLELVAERIPEAKALLDEVHDYLKAGMAALTFLGVLGASDRALVGGVVGQAGSVEYLPALAVGAGTFLAGKARAAVVGPLREADEDDDLRVQSLLLWVEDLWGGLGPLALILLPLLTLAFFGVALVLLLLAGRSVEAREEATKVPCTHCGQSIYASATLMPLLQGPESGTEGGGAARRDEGRAGRPRHARLPPGLREAVPRLRHEARAPRRPADV